MKYKMTAVLVAVLSANAFAEEFTVVSFGGVGKKVQTEAFFKPFEQETKNKIIVGEFNGEMGKIKAMVDTNSVVWDVVQIETPELIRGCESGVFERLDAPRIGKAEDFVPGSISECGAGLLVWSMVMAFNKDNLKESPSGWTDFWDVKKFPGKRSMRKAAKTNLEIALMADGVPRTEVYNVLRTPEGVDRAFKKLGELKPYIQWWEAGAQPMQFLASNDVVMTTAYNGRVFAAQEEGAAMQPVWTDSLYAVDSWAIPKGSKHKDLAQDFIAFSLKPEHQKIHTQMLGYGSVNVHTNDLVDPSVLPRLNTAPENIAKAIPIDNEFWIDYGEDLEERFNAWAAQ